MELKRQELIKVEGGLSITGTLINSLTKGMDMILNLGRNFGSSLRRIYENKICPL